MTQVLTFLNVLDLDEDHSFLTFLEDCGYKASITLIGSALEQQTLGFAVITVKKLRHNEAISASNTDLPFTLSSTLVKGDDVLFGEGEMEGATKCWSPDIPECFLDSIAAEGEIDFGFIMGILGPSAGNTELG